MNLPADVARCGGLKFITFYGNEKLAVFCENCARRLSPSDHPWQPWVTPPESLRAGDECEFRIENVEVAA